METAQQTPLWEAGVTRDKIVVISDIHLGIDDRYTETLKNRPLLIGFLKRLAHTSDVRELVIGGDFLDAWFLPVFYPPYTDEDAFYRSAAANNSEVFDALAGVMDAGIKLVYVPGNHDMTFGAHILDELLPGIVQARDAEGLGAYRTGDRNEIVIEHGHRYDVFSAPDTVTNAALCKKGCSILPPGYFYARYAATWVLEGRPSVKKDLPVVKDVPDSSDADQYGAYIYYSLLKKISERMTPLEDLRDRIFNMHIAGFDGDYSYLDFFPAQQADGAISAPVLFRNVQRTWDERQRENRIGVMNSFVEAVAGTLDWDYYVAQAKAQYIENGSADIVVFGHTHVPVFAEIGDGKYYVNDGTWIDDNTDFPEATRSFAVVTTGEKSNAALFSYCGDGSLRNIEASSKGAGR